MIPTKKDIAFVEFLDEGSATVAKDALHNYKLDGENKIKVRSASTPGFCCHDCVRIYGLIICSQITFARK